MLAPYSEACLEREARDRDRAEVPRRAALGVAGDVEDLLAQRRVLEIQRELDEPARPELPALREAGVEAVEGHDPIGVLLRHAPGGGLVRGEAGVEDVAEAGADVVAEIEEQRRLDHVRPI